MNDTSLIERARELAQRAHARQLRKASPLPYMVHLEAVVSTLRQHGYEDETLLSAAYLHDVFEDQPEYAGEVRSSMPAEVVELVALLTEQKLDAQGRKRPKAERFSDLLSQLARGDDLTRRALPIHCADKLDNTRSLVEAERQGLGLLLRLNTRPEEHLPQLNALRKLYVGSVHPSLLQAFDEATRQLEATLSAWSARESEKRSLWMELDEASHLALRALASLPVVKGDHVTLVHRILPSELDESALPHGHRLGDIIEGIAVAHATDGRVQAALVEIGGSSLRPADGGMLHVTISRVADASSFESNAMLRTAARSQCHIPVRGIIRWVDA